MTQKWTFDFSLYLGYISSIGNLVNNEVWLINKVSNPIKQVLDQME